MVNNLVLSNWNQTFLLYIHWHSKVLSLDVGYFQQTVIPCIYMICKTDKEEKKDKNSM